MMKGAEFLRGVEPDETATDWKTADLQLHVQVGATVMKVAEFQPEDM